MNTTQLKKFASEARNILREGVQLKLDALGFKHDGLIAEEDRPVKGQGYILFRGEAIADNGFYERWESLFHRIKEKGFSDVCEEAAYTWFNRLMAIRIMARNGFIAPVLEYTSPTTRIPVILGQAREGQLPEMSAADREALMAIIDDGTRSQEQFALLITAYCEANPVIKKCFGGVTDYTTLLLPQNVIAEGGFVDLINNTDFIVEEDYKSPELIGWLYQFYISEKKDEVFAKKGKFAADEIPAATQIFTPNWIVKYMVQNTLGRIYLDNNPYDTEMREKMQYLVEPSEPTPDEAIYHYDSLEDLIMGDLACGSGHILNEMFDLFYLFYIEEGYSRRKAIENIFLKNLVGIDLDTRAKQLAQFSLLIKACQKDASFLDAKVMPQVLDMPSSLNLDEVRSSLPEFFLGGNQLMLQETEGAFKLLQKAENLGSIMKFNLSDSTRGAIAIRLKEWELQSVIPENIHKLFHSLRLILALTEKYSALVMNPPYMGNGTMNESLSNYVKRYYESGKADLCTVFMLMENERLSKNGFYANIVPPSWMFNGKYDGFRKNLLSENSITTLLYLGRGIFGSDYGSATFVIKKSEIEIKGHYRKLFDEFVQVRTPEQIQNRYLNPNDKVYYASQLEYKKIKGWPIGFWLSEKSIKILSEEKSLSDLAAPRQGFATGDNNRFLHYIWEISDRKRGKIKWIPCTKGGAFRRWYGNIEYSVNWENDGAEMKQFSGSVIRNESYYFTSVGTTWSTLTAGKPSFRFFSKNWLFESKGSVCFPNNIEDNDILLGYLNTPLVKYYLTLFSPTVDYHEGPLGKIPFMELNDVEIRRNLESKIKENVIISKQDWDSYETSWDFETNELVKLSGMTTVELEGEIGGPSIVDDSLDLIVKHYKAIWESYFKKLHANEEELNRQFIEIYGLQDELTPNVPLNEITILQQGEISIEDNQIVWHDDVLMKQLISYAIGCWMGRYRIDKPGLWIAHPNAADEEVCTYDYHGKQFEIDDDGVIPLLSQYSNFPDNGYKRVEDFLRIAFGEDTLTENINFVQEALGMTIEKYMQKEFWKYHKKMYQNRPIYWLFSSKKGAFQCLAYMHRMNAYTVEQIRSKYLLPHIEWLKNRITEMESRASSLKTNERRVKEQMQKDLTECLEYHDSLHLVADQQISFDLDDGVVVNYVKFGNVLQKIK